MTITSHSKTLQVRVSDTVLEPHRQLAGLAVRQLSPEQVVLHARVAALVSRPRRSRLSS
jgi:hypothetical protein